MIPADDTYPFLVSDVMQYIVDIKKTDKDIALIDIIIDYSLKKSIPVEMVGDAISSDVYFKSFIEKDCEMHKIFKTEKPMEDW